MSKRYNSRTGTFIQVLQFYPHTISLKMITEMLVFLTVCISTVFIMNIIFKNERRQSVKFPPGPKGLPLIGYVQLDLRNLHKELTSLSKRYGPIFGFSLFGQNMCVVNDYESINELLVKKSQQYSGRMPSYRVRLIFEKNFIGLETLTPGLMVRRKAMQRVLKMHGESKENILKVVNELCSDIITLFKDKNGEAFDPMQDIYFSLCDMMSVLVRYIHTITISYLTNVKVYF